MDKEHIVGLQAEQVVLGKAFQIEMENIRGRSEPYGKVWWQEYWGTARKKRKEEKIAGWTATDILYFVLSLLSF